MDLKEFTKEALIQIVEGALDANFKLSELEAFVPYSNFGGTDATYVVDKDKIKRLVVNVDFDVAITTTESEGTNGGVSLKVASLLNIGGGGESKTENQIVSRIKYTLPLVLSKNK